VEKLRSFGYSLRKTRFNRRCDSHGDVITSDDSGHEDSLQLMVQQPGHSAPPMPDSTLCPPAQAQWLPNPRQLAPALQGRSSHQRQGRLSTAYRPSRPTLTITRAGSPGLRPTHGALIIQPGLASQKAVGPSRRLMP